MWNKLQWLVGAIVVLAMVAGCGQYGALYMPPPPVAKNKVKKSATAQVKQGKLPQTKA
ncbi:MAG: lipoprotein [Coxiellaceae bacterium]|nr:lipoprotein [Coxiellaceae bacterium]